MHKVDSILNVSSLLNACVIVVLGERERMLQFQVLLTVAPPRPSALRHSIHIMEILLLDSNRKIFDRVCEGGDDDDTTGAIDETNGTHRIRAPFENLLI